MAVSARARGWAAILLAAYGAVAAFVLLVPRPIDRGVTPRLRWVVATLANAGRLPEWFDYEFVEAASHVVIFVPIGVLAVVAAGRRLAWLALLAVIGLGALIELGPTYVEHGHVASALDLGLNALGALLGAAVGFWALGPSSAAEARDRA